MLKLNLFYGAGAIGMGDSSHGARVRMQDGSSEKKRDFWPLAAYILGLFLVQTAYAFVYARSPYLRGEHVLQMMIRLATWTLPVLLYLLRVAPDVLAYLRLRRNLLQGLAWGLAVGGAIVVLNLVGVYLFRSQVSLRLDFGREVWLKAVVLVGFSEEVVFRGFLLQKIAQRMGFRRANLVQAALFLLIHLPGWIFLGQFRSPGIARSIVYVFAMGVLLGWVMERSRSLWACMLIHSFSNFASIVFGR